MGQIEPLGDYMLDPPEDPPECPECDGPMHWTPLTCRECGYTEGDEVDPDLAGAAQQEQALTEHEARGGDR